MKSDPVTVRQAVVRRVDVYLAQLEEIQRNGYKETDPIRMSRRGEHYIMRSCGENKVAALAALGKTVMPGVVIQ
jgi:hypothetical protein